MSHEAVEFIDGAELPVTRIAWQVDGTAIDLTEYTVSVTVGDPDNPYVTKTTGLTTFDASEAAQLVIEWDADELAYTPVDGETPASGPPPDRVHKLRVTATKDGLDDIRDFSLVILA